MSVYLPAHYAQSDPLELRALVEAAPLGLLVTTDADGVPVANQVPFEFDPTPADGAPHGVLRAHVARANPVAEQAAGQTALVIFTGPDHYVSPSWYAAKAEHGRVVPTWNYASVHAYGRVGVFDDRDRLRALVGRLTDRFEAARIAPWSVSDAPPDYIDRMLRAIRGIEIPVERMIGKFKLGQNRDPADRASLRAGLEAEPGAEALAALARRHI